MSTRLMVAVCGGKEFKVASEYADEIWLAETIGRELALAKRFDLVFGACPGYADHIVQSFLEANCEGARIIGLSPWIDEETHRSSGYPFHQGIEYRFIGNWSRSSDIIYASDAAIFFPGEEGTKNEFYLATKSPHSRPALIAGRAFEKVLRDWMERGLTDLEKKCARVEVFEDATRLLELLDKFSPIEKPAWARL